MRKNIATYGVLCSLALVLSFIESQIPAFFAVPGMKLGLTNIVVLAALYYIGPKGGFIINIVRILLVAVLFGNGVSLIYSIAGGSLSFLVMFILQKSKRFHIITVSIAGGVFHNIGQIIVAMILMNTKAIAWYLLVLWFSGIASGAVIGVIGAQVLKRLPKPSSR